MPISKLYLFNVQLPTPNNKLKYIHYLKKKVNMLYKFVLLCTDTWK